PHISTGDIFRDNVGNETALGLQAKSYMDRGELVPDDVVIAMVEDRITDDDAAEGFLLDGFPRTVAQAEALDKGLAARGQGIDAVLRLVVDDGELVARLLNRAQEQGRSDDTRDVVETRLRVYRAETEPLLARYREQGVLHEIDGQGAIDDVRARVFEALRALERSA
ncbi:MAG TPA: adenylate kinase, partial [Euzebyales bacterium]|nr:adenylate kinase [Euzebyales bacterium]